MSVTNQRHTVEWEGDEMLLPDMFDDLQRDLEEDFFVYEAMVNIDGIVKPGHIAYHFTDRQIWIQHTDTLHTVVVNLATAGRFYRNLYEDYHTQRRRFRRLQKQRHKLKAKQESQLCPKCLMKWEEDSNQFGCWNCGFER